MQTKLNWNGLGLWVFLASLFLTACGGTGGSSSGVMAAINKTTTTTTIPPAISSAGTDFYLTLPDHLCVSDPTQACYHYTTNEKMVIASVTATTGTITFNGVNTAFSVPANGETELLLDPSVILTKNETIESKGIHVTSLAPVTVNMVSENPTSADGYLALPTPGLGTNYYVMSYSAATFNGSEFAIVATQNSTVVTITPTASGATQPAGVAFNITLNAGQTYLFQNPATADMTGTSVVATAPIAVIGGHRCVDVPSGTPYCDYLVEQMPDVGLWGNTFHTTLFSGRTSYVVRVLASQNGTTVTSVPSGLIPTTLNAGQYASVVLYGPAEFVSSAPVLVAQYMEGYSADAAGKGDPSMSLVTPVEMSPNSATFGVYGLASTTGAYLNVVTLTSSIPALQLDATPVNSSLFAPIGGTSLYSVGIIPVAPGAHALLGTTSVSAMAYDFGVPWNAVSYAYPVATYLSWPTTVTTTTTTPPYGPPTTTKTCSEDHSGVDGDADHGVLLDNGLGRDASSPPGHNTPPGLGNNPPGLNPPGLNNTKGFNCGNDGQKQNQGIKND